MHIVYSIFFNKDKLGFANDHYYIGQHHTSDIEDGYMGSGKKVKDIYRKYGIAGAKKEILAITESENICNILEKFFIRAYMEKYGPEICLNIAEGGKGVKLIDKAAYKATSKKISCTLKKLWRDSPDSFLERNEKISTKMRGNTNGHGNKGKKKQKPDGAERIYYSKMQIERHKPNPLGKGKSLTRGSTISKRQMKRVYFYSLEEKKYMELESVKTCWRQIGFSSETTANRHCRYCTSLLESGTLSSFETVKAVKVEVFVSKAPFKEHLHEIERALERDKETRGARLAVLESKRREKIANARRSN